MTEPSYPEPPNNLPETPQPQQNPPVPPQPVLPSTPPPPRQEQVSYYQPDSANRAVDSRALIGCGFLTLLMPVLLVAIVFIVVASIMGSFGAAFGHIGNGIAFIFSAPQPPTANVVQSQTIINSIQPMGHLVTNEAQMAKADISVNVRQGRGNICAHSANHVAVASVSAGIDLYAIETDNITYDEESNTYTIVVPRPVITNCAIDKIDQYATNKAAPTCTVNWDDLRQVAQYEALLEFRDDAIEGGLLTNAQRETEIALSSFVGALTGANVQVVFTDNLSEDDIIAGCQPELPDGWWYVEESDQWGRN